MPKISELPAAATLDGSELIPLVQGSTTKRTTTGTLTASSSLDIVVSNPTVGNDETARRAVSLDVTYDSVSAAAPGFTNLDGMTIELASDRGQNVFAGGTNAKKTFAPLRLFHTSRAAGQRFSQVNTLHSYGMGDCFILGQSMFYAGADINGDEGQGLTSVSSCNQQGSTVFATITAVPTPSTLTTTTTQAITGDDAVQTVTVASIVGATVGDWIVVGQEVASGTPNLEAVQITAVAAGRISGIFINNHTNGTTITPALVLDLDDTSQMGEQRVLLSWGAVSYQTGTVASIAGPTFTGSGTAWANNMVGGSASNIGAISLVADNYSGAPFSGGNPLRSWYQITSVGSGTSLAIHTYSTAANGAYRGQGVGAGTYIIRPAARILLVADGVVVCESSSHAWGIGDLVECTISPYPDVTVLQYAASAYSNGGTYRAIMNLTNRGARTFETGLHISDLFSTDPSADPTPYFWAIRIEGRPSYGIRIENPTTAALNLSSTFNATSDNAGKIDWSTGALYIVPDTVTNFGLTVRATTDGKILQFIAGTNAAMNWDGYIAPSKWLKLPEYTVAGAPSAATAGAGALIYVSNGNVGAKTLAMSDGTNWKVIALGATIS